MRRTPGSYLLLITGFLACPCHFPLTLALLSALFGGTALGNSLATYTGLAVGLSTGYFIAALIASSWFLSRRPVRSNSRPADCAACPPQTAQRDEAAYAEARQR
jgi:hypothetical protein